MPLFENGTRRWCSRVIAKRTKEPPRISGGIDRCSVAASDATGRTFNNSREMLRFPIRVGWSINVGFVHVWKSLRTLTFETRTRKPLGTPFFAINWHRLSNSNSGQVTAFRNIKTFIPLWNAEKHLYFYKVWYPRRPTFERNSQCKCIYIYI